MKNGWKIYLLEHDVHSKELAESLGIVFGLERRRISDCYVGESKRQIISKVRNSINGAQGRILTVYGHGSSHKLTYGLCKHVADKRSGGYVYYHFDHHGDIGNIDTTIGSGGFVAQLFNDTKVRDVVFSDEPDYHRLTLARRFVDVDFRTDVREEFEKMTYGAPDAYCSFDLDCMSRNEIVTGWPEGEMRTPELLEKIEGVRQEKNVIGGDVLGYAGQRDPKSHLMYAIVMEALMDGNRIKYFKALHDAAKRGKLDYDGMISEFARMPKLA